ncbi:hypothetical protein K402DRAFT_355640 [Aulographum hederae CBS 113979]|uniref:MARVEL domain-containing protein n=1 Tax=Aulographum hederae CBS 113979 TaxID=1176131 RepID=A0A6G1GZV7_9PEZI|nr:hypothetical protein K402DRAFT_355640 [Aulographum hederae CBS 113979]
MRSPISHSSSQTYVTQPYGRLRMVLLAISALCFVFSIAVVGTAGHTLQVFNRQTAMQNPWWLPLWPGHFDTHGTSVLIGVGAAVLVFNGLYLLVTFVPRFNLKNHPTLSALAAFAATLPSILLSLVAVVYVHVLNQNSESSDTIQTWTCRFKNSQPAANLSIPTDMSNELFSNLCTESKFALYATLVVLILQIIMVGLAVAAWISEKVVARKEKKMQENSYGMDYTKNADVSVRETSL